MRQVLIYPGDDGYAALAEDGLPVPEERFEALLVAV